MFTSRKQLSLTHPRGHDRGAWPWRRWSSTTALFAA